MSQPRPITLECEHVVWLRIAPNPGELHWCVKCVRYETVGPTAAYGPKSYQDGWSSEREGKKYLGTCLWDNNPCGYTTRSTNWYDLRDTMEKHIMREHTQSRFVPTITETDRPGRLPRNSPPPF